MANSRNKTSGEFLLSDLCPYCNCQPHKYRCPACFARTCSLACSRKHKLYSQCTGIRDPAAFVKRSKLASPEKLNQDYNYLISVEKVINRTHVLITDEPEVLRDGQDGEQNMGEDEKGKEVIGVGRLEDPERQKLASHIEATRGVTVRQAPRGMKRARENETAIAGRKRKTLRWTVEWLVYCPNNDCTTQGSPHNSEPIRLLSSRVQERLPVSEAFLAELHHGAPVPIITPTTTSADTDNSNTTIFSAMSPVLHPYKSMENSQSYSNSTKSSRRNFVSTSRFYFKKADVPANRPTLVELAPEKTLSAALKGQVVLEFPTIVVVAAGVEGAFEGCEVIKRCVEKEGAPSQNAQAKSGSMGEIVGSTDCRSVASGIDTSIKDMGYRVGSGDFNINSPASEAHSTH